MFRSLPMLCALMACVCFQALAGASPKDDGQPAKKKAAAEARKLAPNAAQGERPKQAAGQTGAGDKLRFNRDPAQMATMMMQKFDKDGDAKLNAEELIAMMTFMQERRGQLEGNAVKENRSKAEAKKNSVDKDANNNEVGGVKPRRPPTE